ncbi:AraC family transcriptional regulator [Cohnella faecalis]|uniref:AraC family transcriptional regulator n=1 Tax=Cohnella faecalis TaxID=2315694 RepID=A0A398CS82_9BACL|nr:AraC family transcriptional regulator [Cohnella faecalis]RIE01804.1 AraC family transcriptional regulator [Cohnella faecalis]
MSDIGLSIKLVYPIVKTLSAQGIELARFYSVTGFDERLLQDPEARISELEYDRLLNSAAELTDDESFGVRQGMALEIFDLGILGYVLVHSGTIREALASYQRYNVVLCNGIDVTTKESGEEADILVTFPNPASNPSRHCAEGVASSLFHLFSKLSGRSVPVRAVEFVYPEPGEYGGHASVWGVMPKFGGESNLIRVSREMLDFPIMYADAKLLQAFEEDVKDVRSRLLYGRALSDRLAEWMVSAMASALPSLAEASKRFHVGTRTLQAKLKGEGTTFNEILSRVRMELAIKYLGNRQYSVGDVAYLLHYSEPSAFQNAFKKWKGETAGQYRLRLAK